MLDRYQQLLLEILHIDPARPDRGQFTDFQQADWEALTSAAIRYRLAFQVSAYLTGDPELAQLFPINCHQRLKKRVQAQLQRNFEQYRRLWTVLKACAEAGLPIVLFKGLWLVEHIYRDPKARPSGDIDVLIHPDDMPSFTRIARKIGCDLPEGIADLRALAPASNEYPLMYRNHETVIDVHWSISHPVVEQPIDEQSIWDRSEATVVGGVDCRTFKLEDNLLYLCFHTAIHHRFVHVGARAFLDIAHMIERPPRAVDWDDFVTRAHDLGWARGAWLALDLVQEHLGIAPPEPVLAALRPDDPPSETVREKAVETLFLNQNLGVMSDNLLRLKDAPWNRKASVLWDRVFPAREELATQFNVPVGGKLFWVNYVRRLGRLSNHFPDLFAMARGDAGEARKRAILNWLSS